MELSKQLDDVERRFESLNAALADPAVTNDPDEYRKTAKATANSKNSLTPTAPTKKWSRTSKAPA